MITLGNMRQHGVQSLAITCGAAAENVAYDCATEDCVIRMWASLYPGSYLRCWSCPKVRQGRPC